ncbi:hypothetical protein T12_3975 [Trichinella patagoniensis]|uniref:Uncharacterized protein n=1 Tax=Trichinella patagoniensis TaxID=990121 RepID=A0A0V1A1Z6_9BILA|nr:hypothetical protein T12_3975 [Trichinella patagoniensis]
MKYFYFHAAHKSYFIPTGCGNFRLFVIQWWFISWFMSYKFCRSSDSATSLHCKSLLGSADCKAIERIQPQTCRGVFYLIT